MIGKLIRAALFLAVLVIGYNYFYGTAEEKAQSKEIVDGTKDVAKKATNSLKQFLNRQKEKLDDGQYKETTDQIRDLVNDLKKRAEKEGVAIKEDVKNLELDNERLAEELREAGANLDKPEMKEKFSKLLEKAEKILKNMNQE